MVLAELSHSGDVEICSKKLGSEQASHPGISVFNLASFGDMAFPCVSVAAVHRRKHYKGRRLASRVLACPFKKVQLFVQICSSQLTRENYRVGPVGICRGFNMNGGFIP
jgi:hypothetical protein